MKYITGVYALNLNCNLDTCGDWHQSSLNWNNIPLKESDNSFYGTYGLEYSKKIPNHEELFTVSNHIRACLDMLIDRQFDNLQGMNKDFICNDKYNNEIYKYRQDVRIFLEHAIVSNIEKGKKILKTHKRIYKI